MEERAGSLMLRAKLFRRAVLSVRLTCPWAGLVGVVYANGTNISLSTLVAGANPAALDTTDPIKLWVIQVGESLPFALPPIHPSSCMQ